MWIVIQDQAAMFQVVGLQVITAYFCTNLCHTSPPMISVYLTPTIPSTWLVHFVSHLPRRLLLTKLGLLSRLHGIRSQSDPHNRVLSRLNDLLVHMCMKPVVPQSLKWAGSVGDHQVSIIANGRGIVVED